MSADDCRARATSGRPATVKAPPTESINLPLIGAVDPADFSLPALTLVLAGLDAFNPCAFFVLLLLLSMMAHQKNGARMLVVRGAFAHSLVSQVGIAFGLMAVAVGTAWIAARLTRDKA